MKQASSLRRRIAATVALVSGLAMLSGCSIYDVPLPGGTDVGDDAITVHVKFRDALDLVPQSNVRVDDVSVGKVTKVKLDGYTADVTVALPKDIGLPDNVRAEIRQTSLLGEKFVSLSTPDKGASSGKLGDGDTIGLDHTGRNPEIEEVLGALGLLLNGGGVGQLKTITAELNNALGGREEDVKSVLDQLRFFMGQLDQNKAQVVSAIENLNRLAAEIRRQDPAIKSALDNLPSALASLDSQRADLVKLLQSLSRLSNVAVGVIQASKVATINSLRDLAPVLTELGKAGDDLPKSLSLITYPVPDAGVGGHNPQIVKNVHISDYANLSVRLSVNQVLGNLAGVCGLAGAPAELCTQLSGVVNSVCSLLPVIPCLPGEAANAAPGVTLPNLGTTPNATQPKITLPTLPLPGQKPATPKPSTGTKPGGGGLLSGLGGLFGNGRAGTDWDVSMTEQMFTRSGYDPGLSTMLLQGMGS